MAINLIEILQVSPNTDSSPDSVNSLTLPLTLFDLHWLKFYPNQLLIFFQLPESTRDFFDSKILPKLKLSLSTLLRHYPPLLGSIKWASKDPKPSIFVSKHDTISLTIAETNTDFFHISGNGLRLATELHPFVPELTVSNDSASVISLQITFFPNQGFSIGISSHHAVFDGRTTEMFIKSWAYICNSQQSLLPQNLTPSFDRTIINIPPQLDAKMLEFLCTNNVKNLKPPPLNKINANLVRVTLDFTTENIEKLRERVMNESTRCPTELQYLSNYVIAYAYVLTCAVKARGGHANRPVKFSYVAGMNHRLKPKVPVSYFGNCVFPVGWFEYEARVFSEEKGFVKIAEVLSESVESLGSRGIETLLECFVEGSKRLKEETQTGSIAGSPKLGIYGSDFGWGKPEKIEIVSIDRNEAFSMLERKDGSQGKSGVEMGVCLKKNHMNMFLSLFNNGLKH